MILNENELLTAVTGAVRSEKTELGLKLHRFTEAQTGYFFLPKERFPDPYFDGYFGRNCFGGAGVTVDLLTDADAVTFSFGGYELINDAPRMANDLLADGVLVRSAPAGETLRVSFRKKKTRRITLYLSYFTVSLLREAELKGATFFRPYFAPGTDILLFGDSITHGAGADHPSRTMASVLGRRLDARILNQGNSGYVYDAATVEKVCEPKLIVMAYGHNDRGRKTAEEIRTETEAFARRVKEVWENVPAVGILPLWCTPEADPETAARFRFLDRKFREAYESAGVNVIDGASLVPHDPQYFRDAAHPNDRGYRVYGTRLAAALTRAGLYPRG